MAGRRRGKYARVSAGKMFRGARVYLSGPMDFVASRAGEKKSGWRTRVGAFLRDLGAVVFDPWEKPVARGLHEYGREDIRSVEARDAWDFADTRTGAAARAGCSGRFWETLHVDLRMVDTSDFVVAYCPTNVYSVGTPHEIVMARQQRKPVLFVSPPVTFPALDALRKHLALDIKGQRLLSALEAEVPIKENRRGVPSLWYMPLVGGEGFFDGFGFEDYRALYKWSPTELDRRERAQSPQRPLLPFLHRVSHELPKKWDNRQKRYVRNDDWLLWDLHAQGKGATVSWSRKP